MNMDIRRNKDIREEQKIKYVNAIKRKTVKINYYNSRKEFQETETQRCCIDINRTVEFS
jgi:hypothetical protein